MSLPVIVNVAVFVLTLGYLYQRRRHGASIASNVLLAVLLGVVLGALAQTAWGFGSAAVTGTMTIQIEGRDQQLPVYLVRRPHEDVRRQNEWDR